MDLHPGNEIVGRPRLVPHRPLPPYSYVSGHAPHPVSHPDGHQFGSRERAAVAPLSSTAWQECEEYLFGIDLFNHGYYWEAHESWEAVWHAVRRQGTAAEFLKGLIKLAAAGVKAREGSAAGAQRHARRCRELLRAVESSAVSTDGFYAGLSLRNVVNMADAIVAAATERAVPLAVYDAVLRVESPR